MEGAEENVYQDVSEHSPADSTYSESIPPDIVVSEHDYIDHYNSSSDELPPPPPPAHVYDFAQESSTSSSIAKEETKSETESFPRALGSMADQVVDEIGNLSVENEENEVQTINSDGEKTEKVIFLFIKTLSTKSDDEISSVMTYNHDAPESQIEDTTDGKRPPPKVMLFIKAGSDRECIGCCPFSQRLFMMLWLKGVVFNVTTVDKATKPKQLRDIAAGTNPPFLLFNGEELTDIQKCEDYIEAELYPPRYPKLACKHSQSNSIGNDIFAKFSAFIKFRGNANDPKRKAMETKLNDALRKFDKYLNEPLDDEIDEGDDEEEAQISKRKFIDGNEMTIADCNMLPKLNMIRVAGKEMLKYEIPAEFTGIARYLAAADETDEFTQTCPDPGEIIWTYGGRKPRPKKN